MESCGARPEFGLPFRGHAYEGYLIRNGHVGTQNLRWASYPLQAYGELKHVALPGPRMTKPIVLSEHAGEVASERAISPAWIEQTVVFPEWVQPDPNDAMLERRFWAVPERAGRILRVVCAESDTEIRVITAFFDRRARRPQ